MISAVLKKLRRLLQHYLNSLHVYSFACSLNISRGKAIKAACVYERIVHPLLYFKKSREARPLPLIKTT